KLRGRIVENVQDLALLGLEADGRHQDQLVDGPGAHDGHLGCRPAPDRMSEEVRALEPGRIDEPEMEAREVVDAFHPVGGAGAPEAGMGGSPHREALPHLFHPPRPPTVAPCPVQDEQRRASATNPRVDVDVPDPDRPLLAWHAPYYASRRGCVS